MVSTILLASCDQSLNATDALILKSASIIQEERLNMNLVLQSENQDYCTLSFHHEEAKHQNSIASFNPETGLADMNCSLDGKYYVLTNDPKSNIALNFTAIDSKSSENDYMVDISANLIDTDSNTLTHFNHSFRLYMDRLEEGD